MNSFQLAELIEKCVEKELSLDELKNRLHQLKGTLNSNDVTDAIYLNECRILQNGLEDATTTNQLSKEGQNKFTLLDRFASILHFMLDQKLINSNDLLKKLDAECLESVRLLRKKEDFTKSYIKLKTRLFYKQQKFNLFHEENEGFAKLLTEIVAMQELTFIPEQSFHIILHHIQSLIGIFHLDPNRIIDILLDGLDSYIDVYGDTSSMNIIETFIRLMRRLCENDVEKITNLLGFKFQKILEMKKKTDYSLYLLAAFLILEEMVDLDTFVAYLHPSLNEDMTEWSKDKNDGGGDVIMNDDLTINQSDPLKKMLREELKNADLNSGIKVSTFTSDVDVALSSTNGGEAPDLTTSMNGNDENNGNETVVNSAAGGIPSFNEYLRVFRDSVPTERIEMDDPLSLFSPLINQRLGLLNAFLYLRDWSKSKHLLSTVFPPNFVSHCSLTIDLMTMMIEEPLKEFANSHVPNNRAAYSSFLSTGEKRMKNGNIQFYGKSKESIDNWYSSREKREEVPASEDISMNDENDSTSSPSNTSLSSIISNSNSGVSNGKISVKRLNEKCLDKQIVLNSYSDFEESVLPILQHIGCGLIRNIRVLYNLLNILKKCQEEGKDKRSSPPPPSTMYYTTITILDCCVLPSLSLCGTNTSLALSIWDVLKYYPYHIRFRIYGEWKRKTYHNSIDLIFVRRSIINFTRATMQRLTKDNVRNKGRQIGKLSHSNPIIVFAYIVSQIKQYDNLIMPVVDAVKFLNPLSYDILIYLLLVTLSDSGNTLSKHDECSLARWLQSLATFIAQIMKRYNFDTTPVFQYIINQLKQHNSYDLFILRELIQRVCGVELNESINEQQLTCLYGGDILRQEGANFIQIKNVRRDANRIKDVLLQNKFIVPLCFLMAQERNAILFQQKEDRRPLKLLSSLFDQAQDTLTQFTTFLMSSLSTEEYVRLFPSVTEIMEKYQISIDAAFHLTRPMYSHAIEKEYNKLLSVNSNDESHIELYMKASSNIINQLTTTISIMPDRKWNDIAPHFFTTFWTLTMYDIEYPQSAYRSVHQQLKGQLKQLESNDTHNRRKRERERLQHSIDQLQIEEDQQHRHVTMVRQRLKKDCHNWFPDLNHQKSTETISELLHYCIFPRCRYTMVDAVYCAKMINLIHQLETKNFTTIVCYDRIFCDSIYPIILGLSENEANRFGTFLSVLLHTAMERHGDPVVYKKECSGFPGFLTVFKKPHASDTAHQQQELDYENYRHVVNKWHFKLAKAIIVLLASNEFMPIRNSVIILTKIIKNFPILKSHYTHIELRVKAINDAEKDKRKDLYALSLSYLGLLKSREEHMIEECELHTVDQSLKKNQKYSLDNTKKTEADQIRSLDRKRHMPNNDSPSKRITHDNDLSNSGNHKPKKSSPTRDAKRSNVESSGSYGGNHDSKYNSFNSSNSTSANKNHNGNDYSSVQNGNRSDDSRISEGHSVDNSSSSSKKSPPTIVKSRHPDNHHYHHHHRDRESSDHSKKRHD
ncbi:hypothetical protein SNEBB_009388 [Seison nebaliae]|nr:hypothetical protein SNEBB_009388 [Seison nebaliae]